MPFPGPDTRVTELRVPGLAGTQGVSLLDSTDTVQVAGDTLGEIVQPADRQHRPAPGPVLRALGTSVPRTLEGYLWSKMTSGGAANTFWALLFPFTLANVAHWMLPPIHADSAPQRLLAAGCRALLRLAAMLLTMLLVSQLAVVSLDLLAAQCLAPGSGCLSAAPTWLRDSVPARTVLGVLPLLVVVVLLYLVPGISRTPVEAAQRAQAAPQTERDTERSAGTRRATDTSQPLPGDVLGAADNLPVLRCLHATGTLAMLSVLLLGGPGSVPERDAELVLWSCAVALTGLALLGVLRSPARMAGAAARGVLLAASCALLLTAAALGAPLHTDAAAGGLTDTGATVEAVGALLIAVCVLFAGLLVPTALLARRGWRTRAKRLRPWAGGWAAAPVLILACLLGGGFGAGTAVGLRELVGDDSLRLPESYTLITMLWGSALAVAVLLAVTGFAVAVPLRRVRRGIPEVVRMLHPDPGEHAEAAAAWARASWERHWMHRLVLAFVLAMSAGAVALLVAWLTPVGVPAWLDPLSAVGVVTLGGLAIGLLRTILSAATSTGGSRPLGAFADLVSFWPRMAHPAVPPCYALKAIPEITARAREHLSEPETRVVLAGYHIGGLLAAVAAGRLARSVSAQQRERIGLLTAGCPLQWGYQRAFPAVFPMDSLARLHATLDGRWRGLCRGTDSFGGGATTWRHQVIDGTLLGVGFHSDGNIAPLPEGRAGPTGAVVLGGDHWLPDPMHGPRVGHRWAPGVLRNTDYVADPEWDRAVTMAAELQRPDSPQTGHETLWPVGGRAHDN